LENKALKTIETVIYMEPVAKGRPRVSNFGGHARIYTPKATATAEADVKALIRTQVMRLGQFDAGVPLHLTAIFYRKRPVSLAKKVFYPVQKPDVDNYLKLLLDALNKFVFPDDSAVVSMIVKKRFATPPSTPCIYLIIKEEREV
jgi:Holliday junction resolvase RusA-like endonuclease